MAGYERQSSAEIIPGATVRSAPINAEYNQLVDAFAALTGHKHDGSTGEGGYVPLIADADAKNKVVVDTATNTVTFYTEVGGVATAQVVYKDGVIEPATDNDIDLGSATKYFKDAYIKGDLKVAAISATGDITPSADGTYDLGSSTLQWQDLWIDGTATIDTLQVDENATVTGNLTVNGNTTVGSANTDTAAINAKITTSLVPNADDAVDLGAVGNEWRNAYIDGIANIDSLVADTADINGGNIDGTAIGFASASTGVFTQVDVDNIRIDTNTISATDTNGNINLTPNGTGNVVTSKMDINGGTIDAVTIGTNSAVTDLRVDNIKVDGNTISSTNTNGNINLTPDGTGKVVTSKVDINGGAIDGTPIGATTTSTGAFTTVSASSGFTGDIAGDVTGNVTATSGTTTLYGLSVTNSMTMNSKTIGSVATPTLDYDAATKKYVDDTIAAVIDTAPDALNTLNEIAAALGDDADFTTSVYDAIGTKLTKAGDTMSGNLSMGSTNRIVSVADPVDAQDVATKNYIDTTYVDYSSAGDAATDARKLATEPEDSLYTLADGTTTGYSALHYHNKVAATYDLFDDRYLGAKSSDPALDNDGNALVTGAMYFDSANNVMKVFNGTEWQAASSSIEGIKGDFVYTATANQTVFTGTDDNGNDLVIDVANLATVYLNGVRLLEGSDYTVSAPSDTITMLAACSADDIVEVEVFGNFAGQSGAEVSITGGTVANVTLNNANVASGDLTFADNQKAIFGAGSDLSIYHRTSPVEDDRIESTGTLGLTATNLLMTGSTNATVSGAAGYVQVGATDVDVRSTSGAVNLVVGVTDILSATSTGVTVAGSVTLPNGWTVTESGGSLYFAVSGTNKMKLDSSGNLDVVGNINSNATIS